MVNKKFKKSLSKNKCVPFTRSHDWTEFCKEGVTTVTDKCVIGTGHVIVSPIPLAISSVIMSSYKRDSQRSQYETEKMWNKWCTKTPPGYNWKDQNQIHPGGRHEDVTGFMLVT